MSTIRVKTRVPENRQVTVTLPSTLTLLGLMRHLTEMERVYAAWALGPKAPLQLACRYR